MQYIGQRPIYSISDLLNDIECEHLTHLEGMVVTGALQAPQRSAGTELIARKGNEHEARFLRQLKAQHDGNIVEFPTQPADRDSLAALRESDNATLQAMASGTPCIYQATFFDGTFLGRADFLTRVETPSAKWPWSYEVVDTKLALNVKAQYALQLSYYAAQVARLQGTFPEYGHVILGSGLRERFRLRDYAAYFRHQQTRFLERMAAALATYPLECKQCAVCRWSKACDGKRDVDDHLSLVANIRSEQILKLNASGITTVSKLATAAETDRPGRISADTFAKLRAQARLQHRQRTADADSATPYAYELLQPQAGQGFAQLPMPDTGDVFFDIEGDPMYAADHGLEYLFGFMLPLEKAYRAFWARNEAEEKTTFEQVIDFLVDRRRQYPNMHIYHYAPYEITAMRRLSSRYATREAELDLLLRANAFIDLYAVVRQSLRISQPSYSIKKLEPFYGMTRRTDVRRGDDSIVQFELWLTTHEDAILEDIERYNDDDCKSTWLLHEWLLKRKVEAEQQFGRALPWRTQPEPQEAAETPIDDGLAARLLDGVPVPCDHEALGAMPEDDRARWLLGHMLEYHRRDAKPGWWKYYDRLANLDDLIEGDHEAIGGIMVCADIAPFKHKPKDRNFAHTYSFPEQQHNLGSDTPCCPELPGAKAVTVVGMDTDANRVVLKLNAETSPRDIHSLIPGTPMTSKPQRDALKRVAEAYVSDGLSLKSAALEMILARSPRLFDRAAGAVIQPADVTADAILRVVEALDASYLVIQGPPGTGKTTKAAAVILDLLKAGKTVGILSGKHKAIHNLLAKIEEVAEKRGQQFRGVQKFTAGNEGSKYKPRASWPMITPVAKDAAVTPHDLTAGTQWHFASADLVGRYDYLFIDEAGQLSLADAIACAPAARNVILLGDPLQLAHVSQGSHPIGGEPSILEHLLQEHATVQPERGIFLDVSYRMSPQICAFISETVYEGRLSAGGTTAQNAVHAAGEISGHGLRFMPVEHFGNSRESVEEARVVADAIERLLRGTVTADGRARRPMTADDVLVVAPYNAQRKVIGRELEARGITGVQVGTVDKFQGLEAPVVFYSMAASSGADVPRGVEFLFEVNRLNVAISRAQCLAVLVCSARLLDTKCGSAEEMRMASVLCELVERCRNNGAADRSV